MSDLPLEGSSATLWHSFKKPSFELTPTMFLKVEAPRKCPYLMILKAAQHYGHLDNWGGRKQSCKYHHIKNGSREIIQSVSIQGQPLGMLDGASELHF